MHTSFAHKLFDDPNGTLTKKAHQRSHMTIFDQHMNTTYELMHHTNSFRIGNHAFMTHPSFHDVWNEFINKLLNIQTWIHNASVVILIASKELLIFWR